MNWRNPIAPKRPAPSIETRNSLRTQRLATLRSRGEADRAQSASPRRLFKRVPVAAWVCAIVATMNAACWSLITPIFQGIDEPDHFAYVQQLAETGHLPAAGAANALPSDETAALIGLHQQLTRFKPQARAISSLAEQRTLDSDLALHLAPAWPVNAGTAGREPPLYYVLATIPYELASGGNILARVQTVRLLSALLAGLAALLSVMFVREILPGTPWAWTVGGLGVALMPMLGFISSVVNPESMLIAITCAVFYLLARAFRHGLTSRRAAAIGLAVAAGFLTKLNFIGLAPGALIAIPVLTLRAARATGRIRYAPAAVAYSIACAPVGLYILTSVLSAQKVLATASVASQLARGSMLRELDYIWQFYLPKLPGMHSEFPGILTTRNLWFDGLVGRFGWDDTFFPAWIYTIALIPAGILTALCLRALVSGREKLELHSSELAVYATMAFGLALLVGATSYISEQTPGGGPYWQPRYFLPLIPLLAVALALAARGAGRRWGPIVGVLIVTLILAQDVFGQLQTIARYYG